MMVLSSIQTKSWIFSDDSSSFLDGEEMANMLRETTVMFEGPNPKHQDINSLFDAMLSSASPEPAAIKGQALTPKSTNKIVHSPTPQQVKNGRTCSRPRASKKRSRRAKLHMDGLITTLPGTVTLTIAWARSGCPMTSIRRSAIAEGG